MSKFSNSLHQETLAARYAVDTDEAHGAVIPPLYMSSNFSFQGFGEKREYDYTRSGNPTRDQLAGALAALEGGSGGVITASGMSAVHLATQLVKPGELIVAPHDCYGGCHRLFTAASGKGLFDLTWLPLWETASAIEQILELEPRMVWIETPSNPLLRITDIAAIAEAAHRVGALVVVDNTFLSPAGQRPFSLGADIVLHSTTKYINGHSDVVGGAVLARDEALVEELSWWANCLGLTGSPFDSFQTLRGLRTLNVRYRQHAENAAAVAAFLDGSNGVRKVYYPGLSSHPGHGLARRQQESFGAMISFEIDASEEEIPVFLSALKLFTLAESLGGVESLVAHPASMTHAAMCAEDQAAAGICPRLLRLSVGIEHVEDLLGDLAAGFDAIGRQRQGAKVKSVA
ncbi:MAG: cystathionine gamma-synthase [Xanthomonadales bacterium]|nr:cystathionine gamma-synthase [Gammaproteobacteria bacterium]MBT8053620.1 cystathionine gamma-synthase [Gammaproteobacteria bacterium]NND58602.1 cystathionine gamma-synthase [Xanthomonadales bacterium]NNK51008.1 cystathionine gamma-synthase [Xanthomonadales bacterium]